MRPVAIVNSGGGGQAAVIYDACLAASIPVAGWLAADDATPPPDPGLAALGGLDRLRDAAFLGAHRVIVGAGPAAQRRALAEQVLALGGELATILHPAAVLSALATIGEGSFLAAGAVVGAHATLGRCVTVNAGATIDHDNVLGDGVSISPGVHLAGFVRCEQDAFVGVGASVAPGVTIGARALVGAGAVVIREVPADARVAGNPAKPLSR